MPNVFLFLKFIQIVSHHSATGNLKNEKPWLVYCTGLHDAPDSTLVDIFQKTFTPATVTENGFLKKVNDLGPFVLVQRMLNVVSKEFPNINISSMSNSTTTAGETSLMQYIWTVTVRPSLENISSVSEY